MNSLSNLVMSNILLQDMIRKPKMRSLEKFSAGSGYKLQKKKVPILFGGGSTSLKVFGALLKARLLHF